MVYENVGNFLAGMGVLILLVVIAGCIYRKVSGRQSQQYRKLITDMFVAAKTRALAKAEGLNLDEEEKIFKAWLKKERVKSSEYDLDDVIEEELKEKVLEEKKEELK